jgi:hypothetical protein
VGRRDGYEAARNPRQFRDDPNFVSGSYPDDTIMRSGLLATPGLRWVGAWSLKGAVWVLLSFALLGMVGTIVVGRDPGFLIGLLTIVGSLIAAFGVQRRAVHKLLPVPALSYLVTTTIAGIVHERHNLNDSKEYVTNFLSWIGGAFFAVVWATVLVVVIALARWVMSKRVASGNLSSPGGPAAGRNPGGRLGAARASGFAPPATRSGREAPGSRDMADPRDPYGGSARGGDPYGGGARGDQRSWGDRESRDSRGRRDPWGEPADRGRGQRGDRDPWGEDRGDRGDRGPWGGDASGNGQTRDPRDSRDYRDDRRPRPGGGPRDLW